MRQPLAEAIVMKTRGDKSLEVSDDGALERVGDELALDQLHGDEGLNEELTGEYEVDSGIEDERSDSEFDYGDLKEHVIVNDDKDVDEDDLNKNNFGAEDGEGAVDNEDDYGEY
ncbi:hypothetical protein M405DRAFT_864927 [Rhizopogon salebrosus TDB-379]|nr:hypothetical protein M405DRAFT_864927 [Rhizopogon salebrosus TDB-379]